MKEINMMMICNNCGRQFNIEGLESGDPCICKTCFDLENDNLDKIIKNLKYYCRKNNMETIELKIYPSDSIIGHDNKTGEPYIDKMILGHSVKYTAYK